MTENIIYALCIMHVNVDIDTDVNENKDLIKIYIIISIYYHFIVDIDNIFLIPDTILILYQIIILQK